MLTASRAQALDFCCDDCPGTTKESVDKQDSVFGATDLRKKPKAARAAALQVSIAELASKISAWAQGRRKYLLNLLSKTLTE